jgi:N-methylhydantoinase A
MDSLAFAKPETWRIGVDIGGTFTDLVLASSAGAIEVHKVPTVTHDPSQGALDAIAGAAAARGMSIADLLGRCTLFVHGTTVATNTLLEGKGARVGLVTSKGFRDALEIRRGIRENPWDHRTPYRPVLVPRYLRLPAAGRLDRQGREIDPLDLADVETAIAAFREEGVQAVAICLFNSYLSGAHEAAAAERIRELAPDLMLSVSHAIAPVMGEYERTTTSVLNAYVSPVTLSYVRSLNEALTGNGLQSPFVLIQSNGGAVSVTEIGDTAVTLLLSGPAAGVGALNYYREAIGSGNLISIEIGGTSCDVIIMNEGEVGAVDLLDIGGYKCVTPSVDVHTIGAGGGTIARVDSAGFLQVGPEGAGARPGPACFGHGGTEPTITDAQVVLGRLKPGPYANGALVIDELLAEKAIAEKVAKPLGLSVEQAAAGIIQMMEQKLLHAVQRVSTERGHNPERFTLIAGGGAGPLHAASVGRALACAQVYIPKLSGAFCAMGMLNANIRHDYMRVLWGRLNEVTPAFLEEHFAVLEARAVELLAREGFAPDKSDLKRAFDLRYLGQQWDVTVEVGKEFEPEQVRSDFEKDYARLFGHTQPDGVIEITKIRLIALGLIAPLPSARAGAGAGPGAPVETRRVWIDQESGWRDVPIYRGSLLGAGQVIVGPAIIDEQTTTVMIGHGDRLVVDPSGNYMVSMGQ